MKRLDTRIFPLYLFFLFFFLTFINAESQQLAFPSAEGFGRFATGGRGGEVYHVTNLNDSGPGSFRDAVSQPNRIVVFDVGGVINISTRIVISHHVYVAGQTAPGGGITIYGNGIALNGDSGNNIIRYIRIRMGKNGDSGKDAVAISAGQNYIFDHVSVSWGRDGTFDVNGTGIDNLTVQDCIIGQGINNSNHSTGGLMQSGKWSVIRSLYIDNKTRNPKARGTHEFINSVLYNWASNGYIMGDTEGLSECNLIGNYFIYGPSSSSNSHITNTTPSFHVYPEDNWVDADKDGVLDGTMLSDYKTATVESSPFPYPGVNNQLSAPDALKHVIGHVGASKVRDEVDEFLIGQLLSYGTEGMIINTEDDNGIPGNVGTVANGTPPADTDRDGMPDQWEIQRGLNPNVADDKGDDDKDGYTNIEEYLSCIVGEGDGCQFNPIADCNGVENGEAFTDDCGECVGGNTGKQACYLDCNGVENGNAILDDCGVCTGGNSQNHPCTGSLEAELACTADGILLESNNSGFSGEGYVNTDNLEGASASWNLNSDVAHTVTLTFRFANGGQTARDGIVFINGAEAGTLTLPATGAWTNWELASVNVTLSEGSNKLLLEASSANGLANIDLIHYSAGVSEASCIITSLQDFHKPQNLFYPNPTTGLLHLSESKDWSLLTTFGEVLKTRYSSRVVDMGEFSEGIYLLKIDNKAYKVIKE